MWKYLIKNTPTPLMDGYIFKMQHSFEKRKEESSRILEKYPDKIPTILEKSESSQIPTIDKQKFVIAKDVHMGQFLIIIRKKIDLDPSQALFLLVDNKYIPISSETCGSIYQKYADKDGFLYITYSAEQTFGF